MEAVPSDEQTETTITLNTDIVCRKGEIVTVPAGKKIRLDMAGHSVTVEPDFEGRPIINEGSLTITGNGTIDSSASEDGGWGAIHNKGTLLIENGVFKGSWKADGAAVRNTGSNAVLIIRDGVFSGATRAIVNEGTVTIDGGTFTGTTCSGCDSRIWAYTIVNTAGTSHMVINGGDFTGTQGALSASAGYLEVNGGTFKTVPCQKNHNNNVFYALYVAGEQENVTCIVNDGTFVTEGQRTAVLVGNDNDGGKKLPATVIFNGGTYRTANQEISAIQTGGATGYPIVRGGNFSKIDESLLDEGFSCVQGADGTFQVSMAMAVAMVGGDTYPTLAEAVANADGKVIVLQTDVAESIVIPAGSDITLDLNGRTLTGSVNSKGQMSNVVTNNGTLTIQDTAGGGSILGGTDNGPTTGRKGIALVNGAGAHCTVLSGTIRRGDNGTFGNYTVKNDGVMEIRGGTIQNNSNVSSLIINNAQMTISGGLIRQDSMTAVKNEYCATSLEITGSATVQSANNQALQNWSKAVISGGTVTGNRITLYSTEYTLEKYEGVIAEAVLEITGGSIDCAQIQGNNYFVAGGGKWTDGSHLSIGIGGNAVITTTNGIVIDYVGEGGERPQTPAGSALITEGAVIYGPTETFEQYLGEGLEIRDNKVVVKEETAVPDTEPEPEPEPGTETQPSAGPAADDTVVTPPASDGGNTAGSIYYPPSPAYDPPAAAVGDAVTAPVNTAAAAVTAGTGAARTARPAAAAVPAGGTPDEADGEEISDNEVPAAAPEDVPQESGSKEEEEIMVEDSEVPLASGEAVTQPSFHWFAFMAVLFAAAAVIFFFILFWKRRRGEEENR